MNKCPDCGLVHEVPGSERYNYTYRCYGRPELLSGYTLHDSKSSANKACSEYVKGYWKRPIPTRTKLYGVWNPYDNLTQLPFRIPSVDSQARLFDQYIDELKPSLIVEVGTWFGASAIHMTKSALKHTDKFEMICVDTWLGSCEHWTDDLGKRINGIPITYQQFMSNIIHEQLQDFVIPLPIDSINGYHVLMDRYIIPDLIYVDAGHQYQSAKYDIDLYSDLLRKDGVLIMDDIDYPPVFKAATEVLGKFNIIGRKGVWFK